MSDASHENDDHDHSHDDGEVHSHVGSYQSYLAIFFALIFFTLLTVGIASIHLGPANLAVAVIVASIKAALVCTFFMHLKDDNRFNSLILISAVLFIGVFFAYTTNDTGHRAKLDLQAGSKVDLTTGYPAPGAWEPPPIPVSAHSKEGGGKKE